MLTCSDECTGSFDYAVDSANNPPTRSDVYVLDSTQAQSTYPCVIKAILVFF